jgi:hypothetical protein
MASTVTFDFQDRVRVQVTYDLSHAREATEIRSGWREGLVANRTRTQLLHQGGLL